MPEQKKKFTTGTLAKGSKLGKASKDKWKLNDAAADDDTVAEASEVKVPKRCRKV